MAELKRLLLFCMALLILSGCNEALTKKEEVTSGVTVLLPEKFEKVDTNDGQILFNSKIGSANFKVFIFRNMKLDTMSIDRIKQGMEKNVARFLEPSKGKILHRKDSVYGKIVQSDFEFEIANSSQSKYGAGRFVVKGNEFIGFIYETVSPETTFNKNLRASFLNSVRIDQ